jgi:RimJ/RimL family protein N-acetyltransferase
MKLPGITNSRTRVHPVRDLTTDLRPGDPAALARLWNASSAGWPTGFGHGRHTAAEFRRLRRETCNLCTFVAEVGRRMVAYCSLWGQGNQHRWLYVPLLNADPSYHGKGYGKSVMLAAVDWATHHGYDVIHLHTWPGNRKAMSLYQRTGCQWAPRGSVFMENFIPLIRRSAVGRRFFATRDWYTSYQRQATLSRDEILRRRQSFYAYRFRGADGAGLRFLIHQRGQLPAEIETDRFRIELGCPTDKPIAGVPQTARLRVTRKSGPPLAAVLAAGGDPAVRVRWRRSVTVGRGFTERIDFHLDPAAAPKRGEPPATLLWVDAKIDGVPMRLGVGFAPRPPIEVSLQDAPSWVAPGEPLAVKLRITSNLPHRCRVRGRVTVTGARTGGPIVLDKPLAARGKRTVPLRLRGSRGPAVCVRPRLRLDGGERPQRVRIEPMHVAVRGPGTCGGWVERGKVILTAPAVRVEVSRRHGGVSANCALGGAAGIGVAAPTVGPPYEWRPFFADPAEVTLEPNGNRITAVLTGDSAAADGLTLRREVAVFADGRVRVRDGVRLAGRRGRRAKARYELWREGPGAASWTSPAGDAVVDEPIDLLPFRRTRANRPVEAMDWPESWTAVHCEDGTAAGVIWPADYQVLGEWLLKLTSPLRRLRPGRLTHVGEFHLLAGPGDWRAIRAWWRRLIQEPADRAAAGKPDRKKTEPPHTRGLIEVGPQIGSARGPRQGSLWLPAGGGPVRMAVDLAGHDAVDCRVVFPTGQPVRVKPSQVRWEELIGPDRRAATVQMTPRRGVAGPQQIEYEVHLPRLVRRQQMQVVVADPRAPREVSVRREADGLWRLDNGLICAAVAPQFGGAMVELIRDGVQWLECPWPQVGVHDWFNPWYGGISPTAGWSADRMALGRFTGRAVRHVEQGVGFRGVEVRWRPRPVDDDLPPLRLRYLLAPGVPVVRCELRAGGGKGGQVRLLVFARGMRGRRARLHTDRLAGDRLHAGQPRRAGEYGRETRTRRWLICEDGASGRALCAAVGGPLGQLVCMLPGSPGPTASFEADARRLGGRSAVCWIAPCPSLAEAKQWTALAFPSTGGPG